MEAKAETQKLVSKDTIVSDVLMLNPKKSHELTEAMTEFGIHCVGCGAAGFETLEQGVLGHGFSEEQLNSLIKHLNEVITEDGPIEQKKEETKSQETEEQPFKVSLTKPAYEKITGDMKKMDKEGTILHISAVPGGCSGFMYNMKFKDTPSNEDLNMKQDSLNLAVDKETSEMLEGLEIDYVDTLNDTGFKFNNPKAEHGCGCGKSFA